MNLGDKVIYTLDENKYLGIIIAIVDSIYKVSIIALGKVIDSDGSDIEKIA